MVSGWVSPPVSQLLRRELWPACHQSPSMPRGEGNRSFRNDVGEQEATKGPWILEIRSSNHLGLRLKGGEGEVVRWK